jgi:signal transduction histidine kinase
MLDAPEAPPEGNLSVRAVHAHEGSGAPEATEPGAEESATLALNPMMNSQVQDIQAAQAGDQQANARVVERGRQVPIYSRRTVSWEEANLANGNLVGSADNRAQSSGSPNSAPGGIGADSGGSRQPSQPSESAIRAAMERARAGVEACTSRMPLAVRITVRGVDGRPERIEVLDVLPESESRCVRNALSSLRLRPFSAESLVIRYAYRRGPETSANEDVALDNMFRPEAEVDYTPMTYRELGSSLVLYRLVSHEGASVVQGVLLDRDRIVHTWIPSVIARRVDRDSAPTVVAAGSGTCAVRRPGSGVLSGVDLCFAPAVLARASARVDDELGWQIAALCALWLMTFLAAAAIVLSARRADALSRQKSAFVSAVSHELRTPLTTLRMHAEMLEEGLVTDTRRPKVHAELVRESVRLARLVDNVLSLSRLEEGKRHIRASDADLRALVRDTVEGQRRFVHERGFSLAGPEEGTAVEARVDPQAVEQIVVNLLDNAVKYGAGKEKAIEVWVGAIDGAPAIAVRDRGPGIPARERRKVFQRFHRVEREEHAHAPGTGIGLALVAELAEAHGGEASVHPREGGGLEVRVLFAARS